MEPQGESFNGDSSSAQEFARTHENITAEEYKKAVDLLQSFNERSLDSVTSLDGLAEATRGIGEALMKVAFTKGKFNEKYKNYLYAPDIIGHEEELEDAMIDNPSNVFSMTTNSDQFVTLSFIPYGEPPIEGSFEVTIPVNPLNAESHDPLLISRIGGKIFKDGRDQTVQPRKTPEDTEALKLYASLIQQGISKLTDEAAPPPPTEVPPPFYQ